jgi:hypothetical protein
VPDGTYKVGFKVLSGTYEYMYRCVGRQPEIGITQPYSTSLMSTRYYIFEFTINNGVYSYQPVTYSTTVPSDMVVYS